MLGTGKLKLVPLFFYMKYYGKKLLNNEPSDMINIQTKTERLFAIRRGWSSER